MTRFYVCQIALAINNIHTNNIIYRDLKLENVLIDSHGDIKITDFGLSLHQKSTLLKSQKSYVSGSKEND